jgi:hypothetical protein
MNVPSPHKLYCSIDESGIHKRDGKSVIALVYVEADRLETIQQLVIQAEQATGIHGFHWAHRNWRMRETFIQYVAKGEFTVKLAYIANPLVLDTALPVALQHLLVERHISHILIDGDKPKHYLHQLKKVLRDNGVTVKKIRAVNDEAYPLVRLADAVAGVTRAAYEEPHGKAMPLYRLLQPKIELRIDL